MVTLRKRFFVILVDFGQRAANVAHQAHLSDYFNKQYTLYRSTKSVLYLIVVNIDTI